jgi:LemA protein
MPRTGHLRVVPPDVGLPPGRRLPVPSPAVVLLWVVLALVVLVALYLVVTYNGLVRLRNRIEGAWAQVDVQLRRRYDLIPNLVETVKGYATHERETLEAVIRARNAAVDAHGVAEQAQAENMVTGALRQLFALSESYPQLKANEVFLNLQEELSGTEGRIAYARQYYNDSVERYNTKIQSFPAVLVAGPLRFTEREYFEADEATRGPVQVDFGNEPS